MAGTEKDQLTETQDFDSSIAKLEELIRRLEEDDATLQQALEYFEQGIQLSRAAQKALAAAEQQVNILCEENDEVLKKSLTPEED